MPKSRYTRDKERGGYRFNFKQANGKYTTLRAATVPEMDALIRKKIKERDEQFQVSPPQEKGITVSEVADRWLRVAEDGKAHNTVMSLHNSVMHIKAALGDKPITSVLPADVDDMLLNLPGKSANHRHKVLLTFRRICTYAVDNRFLATDPTAHKKPSGAKAEEVTALTREQQAALLDAVKGTRVWLFCLLLLRTGLRPEEARGLTWDAVDLDAAVLTVKQTVTFHGNRAVVSDALKTKAARRRLPIPGDLLEALRAERQTSTSDFVIHDKDGKPLSNIAYHNLWKYVTCRTREPDEPLRKKHSRIDRPLTFTCTPYQLRHTYITELCAHSAETGLDIKTIQYLAGHSNPSMTLRIYAHVQSGRDADTAQKVQSIFK